jgi:hypothetical protein
MSMDNDKQFAFDFKPPTRKVEKSEYNTLNNFNIQSNEDYRKVDKPVVHNFDDIKSKIRDFKQMKKEFTDNNNECLNFEVSREALKKYKKSPDRQTHTDHSHDYEPVNKQPAKSEGQVSPRSQKIEFNPNRSRLNQYSNLDSLFDKVNDKVKKNRSNTPSYITHSPTASKGAGPPEEFRYYCIYSELRLLITLMRAS